MNRTAIVVATTLALGVAAPASFAQGQKPAVTNPAAGQAKRQADKNDDMLAGRKGSPTAKKSPTQMGSGQGQQGPGQRKAQTSQGQGQEPNTPQTAARKAQMGSGQGQQGPGQRGTAGQPNPNAKMAKSAQKAPVGQGNPGQAGGGQWHKGNQLKGAASAKGAAGAKAAQMHK